MCFVAGCLEAPVYYWAKHGITQEQIRKDNTFCADMTAEKPSAYARGSTFYYAAVDRSAYQQCMQSLGYRKVTEDEMNRERLTAPARPSIQFDAARKACERVTGTHGDIQSCIRYMTMDSRSLHPAGVSGNDKPSEAVTSPQNDETDVCLRQEPNEPRDWRMAVSLNCREHAQKLE